MNTVSTIATNALHHHRLVRTGATLLVGVSLGLVSKVQAQTQTPTTITPISLTLSAAGATTTNTYTQDFNTLASSGTSSTLPAGFGFSEADTNRNMTYTAGTGSGTGGDTYSFGTTAADRALGTLLSSSLNSTIGVVFTNNTGSNLTSLTVSYTGEQYRLGATGRADRLDFQYNVTGVTNASAFTTGTFADFNNLDFSSPVTTGTVGALDGNAVGNRTAVSAIITGLNIANGQSFAFRFLDFDATGSDDGLAIDDFMLTGTITPVPEPGTVLAGLLALGTLGYSQRRRVRGFLALARRGRALPLAA